MPVPRKYDEETRTRAVRMYTDRLREHAESKLESRRQVGAVLDIAPATLDRIAATRSPGRPMPHPRTGRPAQFLFTHHGRRLGQTALRLELQRAADAAGLEHVTPHQLRHTYATALVNAGVSLQALMALLGHVSAAMSLRYGQLFDSTVRTEYERAFDLAKSHLGPLPATRPGLPLVDITGGRDWKDTPPSSHGWLAGSACGHPPKAPAPTPTSASTAPASAPTAPTCPSSPRNAKTPTPWPPTPKLATGSTRPTATTA